MIGIKKVKSFVRLVAALSGIWLSGCATMSKEECKMADWYLKGVDDAIQGYPIDRVVEHGKACARVGIVPSMKDYREGHVKGERLYCVPEKGYSEGRRGAPYNNICPPDVENNFLRAYRDGQELYTIQRNIDDLSNQLNDNQSSIENDYREIDQLKRDVVYSNDSNDRRNKMQRIDDLERDANRLHYESDRAAHELDAFKNDYRIVEDKHYRMGYLK